MTEERITELAYELANLELTKPSALDKKAQLAHEIMQELRIEPWYQKEVAEEAKELEELLELSKRQGGLSIVDICKYPRLLARHFDICRLARMDEKKEVTWHSNTLIHTTYHLSK